MSNSWLMTHWTKPEKRGCPMCEAGIPVYKNPCLDERSEMKNEVRYDPKLCQQFGQKNKGEIAKSESVGCCRCVKMLDQRNRDSLRFSEDGTARCSICGLYGTIVPSSCVPALDVYFLN